ncbi:hypothetical protein Z945_2523 [Sulfitobacter noctilucae]|uniref:hypothetical protein n=1 Tax=Sulfitobacter noctilucae TaxID=1342302 RepID=UPI000AB4D8AB|nr:hypothetical protein [Sulfitobacter noctilucae]KIN61531.1 hypothetical protein Z945_2523 [Sulfitobacter noctilucae]
MDWTSPVGAIAFFTLLISATLALISKQQIERRIETDGVLHSTWANAKLSHGKPADV